MLKMRFRPFDGDSREKSGITRFKMGTGGVCSTAARTPAAAKVENDWRGYDGGLPADHIEQHAHVATAFEMNRSDVCEKADQQIAQAHDEGLPENRYHQQCGEQVCEVRRLARHRDVSVLTRVRQPLVGRLFGPAVLVVRIRHRRTRG